MSVQTPVESSIFFANKLLFHMMFVRYFYLYTLGNHSTSPWSVSTCYLFELMQVENIWFLIFLILFYFWFPARLLYLCIHAVEKYFTINLTFEFIWIFEYLSTYFLFELMQVENILFSLYCYFWKSRIFIHFLSFFNKCFTLALTFENWFFFEILNFHPLVISLSRCRWKRANILLLLSL